MEKVYVVSIDMENIGVALTRKMAEEIIDDDLRLKGVSKEIDEEEYNDSFGQYAIEKFILLK